MGVTLGALGCPLEFCSHSLSEHSFVQPCLISFFGHCEASIMPENLARNGGVSFLQSDFSSRE
jgi:hypothetical protein